MLRSFKMYGDGALGSRGACMHKPYSDKPDQYGALLAISGLKMLPANCSFEVSIKYACYWRFS
jgi:hypothetical protein